MSDKHIADPTFLLRGIENSHVKTSLASMRAPAFDYCNEMITVVWSAEFSSKDSSMQDALSEDGNRTVVKELYKMIY